MPALDQRGLQWDVEIYIGANSWDEKMFREIVWGYTSRDVEFLLKSKYGQNARINILSTIY
jgi:hypothetical protein